MLRDPKPSLQSSHFGLQKTILKFVGLSLRSNENIFHKVYMIFCLLSVASNPFLGFLRFILYVNLDVDIDQLYNDILFFFGFTVVFVKTTLISFKRGKIRMILDTLEMEPFLPNTERGGGIEDELMKDCVNYTRKQAIVNTSLAIMTAISGMIAFLFLKEEKTWKFPFGAVPTFRGPYSYEIIFCYQAFTVPIFIIIFTMTDVLYASILAHICLHCKLLQNSISRLIYNSYVLMMKGENSDILDATDEINVMNFKVDSSNIPWKYLKEQLKQVILYHQAIIDVAREIEEAYNSPLLVEFTGCCICICISMYNASLRSEIGGFVTDLFLISGSVFALSMVSYWGNEVLIESQNIAKACAQVNFIGSDIRFQKALILIMRRSQKPITLTVGKFAPVSLVTLVTVFRASYSYFMVLRRMNGK